MKQSIKFKTLEVEVEFDYTPLEEEVKYYENGDGYPGCNSKLEISNVYYCKNDITSFFEETGLIYLLECTLLESLFNKDE